MQNQTRIYISLEKDKKRLIIDGDLELFRIFLAVIQFSQDISKSILDQLKSEKLEEREDK